METARRRSPRQNNAMINTLPSTVQHPSEALIVDSFDVMDRAGTYLTQNAIRIKGKGAGSTDRTGKPKVGRPPGSGDKKKRKRSTKAQIEAARREANERIKLKKQQDAELKSHIAGLRGQPKACSNVPVRYIH